MNRTLSLFNKSKATGKSHIQSHFLFFCRALRSFINRRVHCTFCTFFCSALISCNIQSRPICRLFINFIKSDVQLKYFFAGIVVSSFLLSNASLVCGNFFAIDAQSTTQISNRIPIHTVDEPLCAFSRRH